MSLEKLSNPAVTINFVLIFDHVVPFILIDDILHRFPLAAQMFDEIARLALNDARVVGPLNHEQWTGKLMEIGARRTLDQKFSILLWVADRRVKVRLPCFWNALHKGEQIIRTKHVTRGFPEFRMAPCECQRHVAAIRASHHTDARHVQPLILTQHLEGGDMIKAIGASPIVVDALHVRDAVARAAAHIGNPDGKPVERKKLNQRH